MGVDEHGETRGAVEATNFIGTFTPRLDDKFRLFLPAKFRRQLEGGLVLTRGIDHNIYGWTAAGHAELMTKLKAAPLTNRDARRFTLFFNSGASDDGLDKQGRVTIPAILRDWANLDRDITVVGNSTRFEIWSSESFNAFVDEYADDFSNIGEEVIPGLF